MKPNRMICFRIFFILLVMLGTIFTQGCAQVPKNAVELSATVGKDIAQVYKSHKELAVILFDRMKNDVNKFVDNVYAPYQIERLLQADQKDFKAGDKESTFAKLDAALKNPDDARAQLEAVEYMGTFVEVIREEIESFRQETLKPVLEQEKTVLTAIDRSYNQIHYANSIVTGHLASIVKVHDAQEELLKEFGIEGLRTDTGTTLAGLSTKIAEFTEKGKGIDEKLDKTEEKINDFKIKFHNLFKSK